MIELGKVFLMVYIKKSSNIHKVMELFLFLLRTLNNNEMVLLKGLNFSSEFMVLKEVQLMHSNIKHNFVFITLLTFVIFYNINHFFNKI